MKKPKTLIFTLLFFVSIVIVATNCASTSKKTAEYNDDKFSGEWLIYKFEKAGVQQKPVLSDLFLEKKMLNLYSASGNSGVNQFFGDVTIDGENFSAGDKLASTKMLGTPEEMAFEDDFLKCLTEAEKITIEENGSLIFLKLHDTKNNLIFTFRKKVY